ncbi:MAG: RraA family protein [Pseudomonadota bacterium]
MIEEPPLLTIARPLRRPDPAAIKAFEGVATSFVADAMDGAGALSPNIRPLGEGRDLPPRLCGPALTVDCGPGDVLALFAALHFIEPGDVVVVSVAGHQSCAVAGDRVLGMIANNGGAGLLTDGPVRDYQGIVAAGLPVFATGLNPASPVSRGPGRVGLPVVVGNRPIANGDIVVADFDGVVTVPFEAIDSVAERLLKVKALEGELDAKVADGQKHFDGIADILKSAQTRYLGD